jgi:hypothetical protein
LKYDGRVVERAYRKTEKEEVNIKIFSGHHSILKRSPTHLPGSIDIQKTFPGNEIRWKVGDLSWNEMRWKAGGNFK